MAYTPWFLRPLFRDPVHSLPVATDATLITFLLNRATQNLLSVPWRLMDSGTFRPLTEGMTYSDHFYGLALYNVPLQLLGLGPVLCHNLLLWLTFPATALAGCWLLRPFLVSPWAAWLGGLLIAFSPVRWAESCRLQLETGIWTLVALGAFVRAVQRRAGRWHLVWAAALVLQLASSIYLGYFLALALGLLLAVQFMLSLGRFLPGALPSRSRSVASASRAERAVRPGGAWWLWLAVALALAGGGVLLNARPYMATAARYPSFRRTIDQCRLGSADLISYARPVGRPLLRETQLRLTRAFRDGVRRLAAGRWPRGAPSRRRCFRGSRRSSWRSRPSGPGFPGAHSRCGPGAPCSWWCSECSPWVRSSIWRACVRAWPCLMPCFFACCPGFSPCAHPIAWDGWSRSPWWPWLQWVWIG